MSGWVIVAVVVLDLIVFCLGVFVGAVHGSMRMERMAAAQEAELRRLRPMAACWAGLVWSVELGQEWRWWPEGPAAPNNVVRLAERGPGSEA